MFISIIRMKAVCNNLLRHISVIIFYRLTCSKCVTSLITTVAFTSRPLFGSCHRYLWGSCNSFSSTHIRRAVSDTLHKQTRTLTSHIRVASLFCFVSLVRISIIIDTELSKWCNSINAEPRINLKHGSYGCDPITILT